MVKSYVGKLITKERHLFIAVAIGIFISAVLITLYYANVLMIENENLSATILTTCGIFIGFIISALGVYYTIPLKPELKERLIKQGYYKQIARNFILSSVIFFISIILCLISIIVGLNGGFGFHLWLNAFIISSFLSGILLCILTSRNFFIIVTKH